MGRGRTRMAIASPCSSSNRYSDSGSIRQRFVGGGAVVLMEWKDCGNVEAVGHWRKAGQARVNSAFGKHPLQQGCMLVFLSLNSLVP
jgi:hypothetical protein